VSFALLLTFSRAGLPIFALVLLGATAWSMSWRITFKKVATIVLVAAALSLGFSKFWHAIKERWEESSLSEEYLDQHTVDSRGYYLRLAGLIIDDRFFGVGLNNWSYAVSKTYGQKLNTPYADYDWLPEDFSEEDDLDWSFAAPAHNLCALTVGELGVPGLGLFLLMWLRWFQMGASFLWRRKRTALGLLGIGLFFGIVGVFSQSLTEWVYRQSAIYLTFHALLGVLARLYVARRQVSVVPLRQPARPAPQPALIAAIAR
jgi:O-antigen ligase